MSTTDPLAHLRESNGTLASFAWPGGYPIVYFTRDGLTVCPDCANRETDPTQAPTGADIFYEGPAQVCEDCGREIASAYGDPDAPESAAL